MGFVPTALPHRGSGRKGFAHRGYIRKQTLDPELAPSTPLVTNLAHRSNILLLIILIGSNLLVILIRGHLHLPLGLLVPIRRLGPILSLGTRLCLVGRSSYKATLHLRTNLSLEPSLGLNTGLSLSSDHHLGARLNRPRMHLNGSRLDHLSGGLPLWDRWLSRLDDWLTLRLASLSRWLDRLSSGRTLLYRRLTTLP